MARAIRLGVTTLLLVAVPAAAAVHLLLQRSTEHELPPAPAAPGGVQVWRILLALTVIVLAARMVGAAAAAVVQPRVVGEMVSGILLGPSVLGLLAPGVYHQLFGAAVLPYVGMIAQIGLAFFMFLVGLEFDRGLLRGRSGAAVVVGQVSVVLPLLLGVAVGPEMYNALGPSTGGEANFALFVGVAMSVTAFPVLARILMERGMFHTPVGSLAMVCAAIVDVAAWLLLAFVVADVRSDSVLGALRTAILSAVLGLGMVLLVRPVLRLLMRDRQSGPLRGDLLPLVVVGVLGSAAAADWIGVHLIFGAFLFGAVCPRNAPRLEAARSKIQDVTVAVLLPPFFASVGLQTQIGLLGRHAAYWAWFWLLLGVAVVGKWAGTTVAALGVGIDRSSATRLGVLMNCKGLTELVILSVGRQLGILSVRQFTILVLVALAATAMTTPLLAALDRLENGSGSPQDTLADRPRKRLARDDGLSR